MAKEHQQAELVATLKGAREASFTTHILKTIEKRHMAHADSMGGNKAAKAYVESLDDQLGRYRQLLEMALFEAFPEDDKIIGHGIPDLMTRYQFTLLISRK